MVCMVLLEKSHKTLHCLDLPTYPLHVPNMRSRTVAICRSDMQLLRSGGILLVTVRLCGACLIHLSAPAQQQGLAQAHLLQVLLFD